LTKPLAEAKVALMKRYHVWTIGCQMNDADAARVKEGLNQLCLEPTADATAADLVVLITCVVRQSAEDKVTGRLASLKGLKRTRPEVMLIVMGCYVDEESTLRTRFPYVDAFLKPSDVAGLLRLVRESSLCQTEGAPRSAVKTASVCASMAISYGCDHHCTYCIVRLRRGKQSSRPFADILSEAQQLVDGGAREITLLGQNVDAYGWDFQSSPSDLADILAALQAIEGLERIRFLTSHPADMTARLIDTVASLDKVCPHFELPVQAGDDHVLQHMGRNYTISRYRSLVTTIRQRVPRCSIATDVIVGFPAETAAQFQATLDLVAELRFDSVHIAKYSPRPGTPAARLPDDVPAEEKERRRLVLEELQTRISSEINAALVGQTTEILVEDRQRGRWKGRTVNNKLVFFDDAADWRGHLARVLITRSGAWSMQGELAP